MVHILPHNSEITKPIDMETLLYSDYIYVMRVIDGEEIEQIFEPHNGKITLYMESYRTELPILEAIDMINVAVSDPESIAIYE